MSLNSSRVPKYRHHKGSGQAFVQVKGRRQYLGKHGTEESRERYRRFVAELMASPTRETASSTRPGDELSVIELVAAYWEFAKGYYVKDGRPTDHLPTVRVALRWLRQLYGSSPAREFGPLALRAVQQEMISAGNARTYINGICDAIRRVFKWGASQELIPSTIFQALQTVPGLRKGRSGAREPEPIEPVSGEVVDATLPHLPPVVTDMVRFQRLTGCRPGEVCSIRPCDIDRSHDVWEYRPESHKMEHHGRQRVILVGPQAQAVLTPYLLRASDAYCFSPREAVEKLDASKRARRKTRVQPSQLNRRKRHPKRKPRERYTRDSYRRAIHRACAKADVEQWSPNRLRHSAATEIRRQFGLEAAQVVLGHAKADVSQIYAERDMALAAEVMRKIG